MEDVDKDRERAEVFDALGHPTRIAILKALSEGPLGFADLKKRLGIVAVVFLVCQVAIGVISIYSLNRKG